MSPFCLSLDKTIALSKGAKAAARFDSLSPLHHKSHFTIEQAMRPPVTRAKDMTRILERLTSGRVQ